MNGDKRQRRSRIIALAVSVAMVIVAAFGLNSYFVYQKSLDDSEEAYYELRTEEKKDTGRDFDALRGFNADIYAWVNVPGTDVDYPILQSNEDNYYLEHNLDHSEGRPGCVYTNFCNTRNFTDYITVVYGHNMNDGSMFGTLHNFDDEAFFDGHDCFTVETEEGVLTYEIYAVVNYNDAYIPSKYDVNTAAGVQEFIASLEACRGNSITHFREGMEIAEGDKLVVLSTCIRYQSDRRFLVVGRLVE